MSVFSWLFVACMPVIFWQLVLLIGLVALVAGTFFLKNTASPRWRFMVCFLVSMAVVAAFLLSWYAYARRCCWVRICEPISLRVGPGNCYHVVGEVGAQELGRIDQVCGDWKCIRTRTCKGWVYLE